MEVTIQSHIDKLDILKQYLFLKIDNKYGVLQIDLLQLPLMSTEECIDYLFSTGIMFTSQNKQPAFKELTFEEYYQNHLNFS